MDGPDVSFVIPAFNEAARLPATLARVTEFCARAPWSSEVIVVVEKSDDGTLDLALEAARGHPNFLVIDNAIHRGKGYAVRTGMLRAGGARIFYMDADLSTPLEEVTRF